jgi:hypothetical protein
VIALCWNAFRIAIREGDSTGWYTVLISALGSWEKSVLCGHNQS